MPGNLVHITPAIIAQWPPSNYVDPYRRPWVIPAIMTLYGCATVTLVLRFWIRYMKHGGGLGIDDAFMFAAWVLSTAYTIIGTIGVLVYDSDRHMWDIPVDRWVGLALMVGIAEILYLLAGACVRISVLLFYRRLVDETCSRRSRYAIFAAIVFTASWVSACTLVITFSCTPIDAYWKSFDPNYTEDYHCVNIAAINYLVGALTIVADIYAVVLPLAITWNFTMPQSQKIAFYLVVCSSLVVVSACFVRNYYLFRLSDSIDLSWTLTNVNLFAEIEVQVGSICASAPALRILFRRYIKPRMTGLWRSKTSESVGRSTDSGHSITCEVHRIEKSSAVDAQCISIDSACICQQGVDDTPIDFATFFNVPPRVCSPPAATSQAGNRPGQEEQYIPTWPSGAFRGESLDHNGSVRSTGSEPAVCPKAHIRDSFSA